MSWGDLRRAVAAAAACVTLALPVPGEARGLGLAPPALACDSVALSPSFAVDRTALCLYVEEVTPLPVPVPAQPPPRRVVLRVTEDGGRTWRDTPGTAIVPATAGPCAPSPQNAAIVCVGPTEALQVVFSADYPNDHTAYVALNDTGLWRTTDLGDTLLPADRGTASGCCSSFWLEPFRRPATENDPLPHAPLALTDGGSYCGSPDLRSAEVLPPAHRKLLTPSTWPLRFVAPPVAYRTPVFLAGHVCHGNIGDDDFRVTSDIYGCDLMLACAVKPLASLPVRVDDVLAGGDHAKRGTLYATATVPGAHDWTTALYRSLDGGRSWRQLKSFATAIGPGGAWHAQLAAVPNRATLFAWAGHHDGDHVLLRSEDHGTTWVRVAVSGRGGMPWAGMAATPHTGYYDHPHLLAAPGGRTLFFLGSAPTPLPEQRAYGDDIQRLWCSTDGGRTWATRCR